MVQQYNFFDDFSSITKELGKATGATVVPLPSVTPKKELKAATDFGKHIGGARKELWGAGLKPEDITDLNEAEKVKYIKVAWCIYNIRYNAPTKPEYGYSKDPERIARKQNEYVEFMTELRELTEQFTDMETTKALCHDYLYGDINGNGAHIVQNGIYSVQQTEKCYGLLSTPLFHALRLYDRKQIEKAMEKDQFCVAKEDKVPAGYSVRLYDGLGYSRSGDWKEGTWYVTKGHYIVAMNFETKEAAIKFAQGSKTASTKARKTKFIPPQLAHIRREGLADVRCGRDITGEDYLTDFGIRGGEFGNWMNEKDAQASLNLAYEAFCDFADAIGIDRTQVGLNNNLSIAFGARGHSSAVAHYEPLRKVINLTKMRGAGSLGHELIHAIDDIVAKKLGLTKMMSESGVKAPDVMKNLLKTMKYRDASKEAKAEAKEKRESQMRNRLYLNLGSWFSLKDSDGNDTEIKVKLDKIIETAIKEGDISYSALADDKYVLQISELFKEIRGRVIPKENRGNIFWALKSYQDAVNNTYDSMTVPTEYFNNSKKMDELHSKEQNGYWSSDCEMLARAGACYLLDKLKEQNGRSDYLCGHAESCVSSYTDSQGKTEIVKAYPEGEERKAINAAFDELFTWIKQENLI